MARKRMISPEFWTDEKLGTVPIESRLLFMGLISNADDEGRLPGNTLLIKSMIFPYDNYSTTKVDEWIKLLVEKKLIIRYTVDSQTYIQVVNFLKHQTINRPTKSRIPAFADDQAQLNEDSLNNHGDTTEDSLPIEVKLKEVKTSCAETELNENIQQVFEFWNQQDIIVHQRLTPEMKKAITKILKDLSPEQVMVCIARYKQVLDDEGFFFSYRWSLTDFLNRKNGIKDFLDDGAKWVSYQAHLKAQKQAKPPEKDPDRFRDQIPDYLLNGLPLISKEGEIIG